MTRYAVVPAIECAVIPAEAGIRIFVILSEAKDLALGN